MVFSLDKKTSRGGGGTLFRGIKFEKIRRYYMYIILFASFSFHEVLGAYSIYDDPFFDLYQPIFINGFISGTWMLEPSLPSRALCENFLP